jgi:hypothetical protein
VLRLSGADGSFFEMDIAGYQFPASVESPLPEYDLNWLLVRIHARDTEGHEWEATDPCLLTWELAELAEWLRKLSRNEPALSEIQFLEPCLWLEAVILIGSTFSLRIHLAFEFGYPAANGAGSRLEAEVQFKMASEDFANAAEACRDLAQSYSLRM